MRNLFIFILVSTLMLLIINTNCEAASISGTINLKKEGGINVYYLKAKDGRQVYLGVDENINIGERKCVLAYLGTNKIVTLEGEILSDSDGYYFYENEFYCKTKNVSNPIKIGSFKFIECEGGIGGAMHIAMSDPKIGKKYFMTAYKHTPTDICDLKSGTIVKIAYRIEDDREAYTYLGIAE